MSEFDAVHDRHPDIGQQQVERLIAKAGEPIGSVPGFDRFMAVEPQRARDEGTQGIFILGDQDFRHHGLPYLCCGERRGAWMP
ncbi:conserved hypothetical protein [Sinorhizobium medicae]|uniref:Uncharacterized protein n=1 Tax=Sinorhizobium medicae TaxID=110321 RepID=A0A508WWS4_9HYPH|nr:conserved hypothetical protein [Sinorhizobium medicae]